MPDKPKVKGQLCDDAQYYVELIIYDNNGPEGLFRRMKFVRSSQAMQYVFDTYAKNGKVDTSLNFEISNHWKNP